MIQVTVTRSLSNQFGQDIDGSFLTDELLLEKIFDNFESFLKGANWTIVRIEEKKEPNLIV